MESGWSVKALHRAIMNSAAYQVSAGEVPESLRADPLNKLFWRRERRALDAESLRDSMLAAAGNLDLNVPGGHPFPPVEKWSYTIHNPFYADYESRHRSVYLMSQRNRRNAYLSLFDAADPNLASGTRVATITPSQALFLMNSPFAHEQAGDWRGASSRERKMTARGTASGWPSPRGAILPARKRRRRWRSSGGTARPRRKSPRRKPGRRWRERCWPPTRRSTWTEVPAMRPTAINRREWLGRASGGSPRRPWPA